MLSDLEYRYAAEDFVELNGDYDWFRFDYDIYRRGHLFGIEESCHRALADQGLLVRFFEWLKNLES